ncbi:MAG: hypothetical protein OEV08_15465 [Nitrospira sp.]|nr:hypothetical protein [Nitrospira sp.]
MNYSNIVRTLCVMTALLCGATAMAGPEKTRQSKSIVLVGASIGKAWHFEKLGERAHLSGYRFGYQGVYDFDKGQIISQLVNDSSKPDVVLIKECATYFPGNTEQYQQQVMSWVEALQKAGIQPVLVTTAPLAEPTAFPSRAKTYIKQQLGMPVPYDSITSYNDWLKEYALRKNIPLFDLESVLRRNESERWLKPEYNSGDGLHLNDAAYTVMDRAFREFLLSSKLKAVPQ